MTRPRREQAPGELYPLAIAEVASSQAAQESLQVAAIAVDAGAVLEPCGEGQTRVVPDDGAKALDYQVAPLMGVVSAIERGDGICDRQGIARQNPIDQLRL